jgi:hypothetical protein
MPKWCPTSCTTVLATWATTSSRVVAVAQDRQTADRDPVGLHTGVPLPALGQRDTDIEAEQDRIAGRRLVLDDDGEVA